MASIYQVSNSILIHAEASTIFNILVDVENWNTWTKSISQISFIDGSSFTVGGKVRITQPKLFPAIWEITEIIDKESFTWHTHTLGVTMTATHTIKKVDEGTYVALSITYKGLLAGVFYRLTAKLTTQYLNMEIHGLKAQSEK